MASKWKPLSKRIKEGETTFDVLHEGVPGWLRPSLREWVDGIIVGSMSSSAVQTVMRDLHMAGEPSDFYMRMDTDDDFLLDVVDYFLSRAPSYTEPPSTVLRLAGHLEAANSVWRINRGAERHELERRVSPELKQTAQTIVEKGGKVGHHLGRAWNKAFGRQSDPSLAFREAIVAVETAALPVICPDDSKGTLGKAIGQIRNQANLYEVSFKSPEIDGVQVLVQMLGLLWSSQWDRHGGLPAEGQDFHVSQKEAEAAVVLATTLIHWFQAGIVKRKA